MLRRVAKVAVAIVLVLGVTIGGLFAAGVLGVPDAGLADNEWGEVTDDRIEVLTTIWIDNPNPFGIGGDVDVEYNVSLAGVELAGGEATDVAIESGNSTETLETDLRQQRLPEWWAAHVGNGERSSLQANATVHASVGPVSGSPSVSHEDEVTTDIEGAIDEGLGELEGEHTAVETGADPGVDGVEIDPTYEVVDTNAQWGEVSENETEVLMTFTVRNPNPYPLPTPAFTGEMTFNDVELARWDAGELEALDAGRDAAIPPGQTREIAFVLVLDNGDVADWLGTHVDNEEFSNVTVTAQLVAEVNGYRVTMPRHDEAARCEYDLWTSIFVDENDNELDEQGCSFTDWVVDQEDLREANATMDLTETDWYDDGGDGVIDDLPGDTDGSDDEEDDDSGGTALDPVVDADPEQGAAPLTVTFDASETAGDPVEYVWAFGDGTAGRGETIEHTFATPGEYEVTLQVIDADGNEATTTRVIEVDAP